MTFIESEPALSRNGDEIALIKAGGARELLLEGLWGFEREALRVDDRGQLSRRAHPFPPEDGRITVDFAENQIELVTSPSASLEAALAELEDLHREAYEALGDELLWPLSLPGRWDEPELLKPASFGGIPERAESRAYRDYLLERYGRARQAISGLHYNFSLSTRLWDFLRDAELSRETRRAYSDRRYMGLARNFLRYRFLPAFLFAASPVIDPDFERELAATAEPSARAIARACSRRFASLRSGPLGYRLRPRTAALIDASYDSLDEYLSRLESALRQRGRNAPLLRSAGEFYAPLRLKNKSSLGKGDLRALRAGGIEYLELRILDLDPFEALGIGAGTARFMHLFSLACLLMPSPPLGRGAADEGALCLTANACSLDPKGERPDPLIGGAIAKESREVLRAMSRLAAILPPEYGASLDLALDILSGKRLRAAERFAKLASESGGGLAAGLALAREHRRKIEEVSAWAS